MQLKIKQVLGLKLTQSASIRARVFLASIVCLIAVHGVQVAHALENPSSSTKRKSNEQQYSFLSQLRKSSIL